MRDKLEPTNAIYFLSRCWALVIVAFLLSACQATLMRGLNVPYALSAVRQETLRYGSDATQIMDIYAPTSRVFEGQKLPLMVFFYGGSWQSGERAWYRFVAKHFALQGYVVVVPDYRKAPKYPFPVFMQDAATSFAVARRQCQVGEGLLRHADCQKTLLFGHSAGAHIAALLSLDARYLLDAGERIEHVSGLIGLSGPYDFLPMTDPKIIALFGGDAYFRDSQPLAFVAERKGAYLPPMLLLHGDRDQLVWPKNSGNLAAAVQAAGGQARFVLLPGNGHLAPLFQAGRGLRSLSPTVDQEISAFTRTLFAKPVQPVVRD